MKKKLRFAPLIRVSTERAGKKGESLLSQKSRIESNVKILDGTIPVHAWKYCGQEHSSEGYERKLFDQMISDCSKGLFDAIMVDDASRWARNVVKSKTTLDVLRKNGIKLFVGPMEIDLFSPDPMFIFDMQIQVAEYYAQTRSYKATLNKIHRLKRGVPASGALPFGRTFDKETQKWGVDPEKKRLINLVAKEYVKGANLKQLIKKYDLGFTYANILKALKFSCGDTWTLHYNVPKFNIDETINVKIPRLLPEKLIKAVRAKTKANRTWTHGRYKNDNLLSRFIFCGHCGLALSANNNVNRNRKYYLHRKDVKKGATPCRHFNSIRADLIEDVVLNELFKTFGDKPAIEKAIKGTIPDVGKIKELKERLKSNLKEISKIGRARNKLLDAIEKLGLDVGIQERLEKNREREDLLRFDNISIEAKLGEIPTKKEIGRTATLLFRHMENYLRHPQHLTEMSFQEKRALLETLLGGKDSNGDRFGIYIKKRNDLNRPWEFTLKGNFKGVENPDAATDERYILNIVGLNRVSSFVKACSISRNSSSLSSGRRPVRLI